MWEEPLSTVGMHLLSGGEEEAELEFECEEVEVEPNVVLFTFFMLLVGLVTLQFLNKVPVPYTAQLLVSALVLPSTGLALFSRGVAGLYREEVL